MYQQIDIALYKTYETEQFFKRYLVNLGCREDRRMIHQHRPVKITAENNSVVISVNQTIIITNIEVEMQQVTFSPVSQSYGEPLLKIKVTSNAFTRHHENKSDRSIEEFVTRQIKWSAIEDQIVGSDLSSGKRYGYKGEIHIRVLGDDGGAQEYALLAVQLLLWTCKFKKFSINKEKIEYGESYRLQLHEFLFPFKYCQVIDFNLTDPSLSEQQNCDYIVSVIQNIKVLEEPPRVMHKSRKGRGNESQKTLKKMLDQWQIDSQVISKLFSDMLSQLQEKNEYVLFAQNS